MPSVSSVVAIIPAAGKGARVGASLPKQFIEIAGAPILIHTLRKFDQCHAIDENLRGFACSARRRL